MCLLCCPFAEEKACRLFLRLKVKEEEIRKRNVFKKYLELVKDDVKNYFDFNSFLEIKCPACSGDNFMDEFSKIGFNYVSCDKCLTLFVNPRPSFKAFKEFYSNSPSTKFWVNEFFKPVADARREKIFKPRAEYISKMLDVDKAQMVGDIGSGFGFFLEELRGILPACYCVAIEPSYDMAEICKNKGLEVQCGCLEDIHDMESKFDMLTAFELLEHLFNPGVFLEKAYSLLSPGGYLCITTLNSNGFDLLLLWEKHKSIEPPHHLNLFNTISVKGLLKRIGFEIVEISTPGCLDWDIVEGMVKNEGVDCGRFWNLLAREGSERCKDELQEWVSGHNFSSHMRVVAKKPATSKR